MLSWLNRRKAVVLMYHGFTDRPSDGLVNYQGNRLRVESFRAQLEWLKRNRVVVPLRRVIESLSGGAPLPDYATALTIDDGYESVYTLGFPALKEYKTHATLFVATQFVDERVGLWPDRLEYAMSGVPGDDPAPKRERLIRLQAKAKALGPRDRDRFVEGVEDETGRRLTFQGGAPENYRPLDWEQAKTMSDSGLVEVGSHGHSHTIMTLLNEADAAAELSRSRHLVERALGRPCDLFCYPNGGTGDFDEKTGSLLRAAGYKCGLTTVPGFVSRGDDPFTVLRFGTDDRDPFSKFEQTFGLGRAVGARLKRTLLRRKP